jgi:hypothetical protein
VGIVPSIPKGHWLPTTKFGMRIDDLIPDALVEAHLVVDLVEITTKK